MPVPLPRLLLLGWLTATFPLPAYAGPPALGDKHSPDGQKPTRTDRYGDPLPEGAVARLGTMRFRQAIVHCVAYCPDGKAVASGGHDGSVRLWDVPGRRLISHVGNHQNGSTASLFTPDGRLGLSSSHDSTIRVWQLP